MIPKRFGIRGTGRRCGERNERREVVDAVEEVRISLPKASQ
jgi:hypothetical protein